jgi:hypothetical protein
VADQPQPLPRVAAVEDVAMTRVRPDKTGPGVATDHPLGCECEDLNNLVPDSEPGESETAELTAATPRLLPDPGVAHPLTTARRTRDAVPGRHQRSCHSSAR